MIKKLTVVTAALSMLSGVAIAGTGVDLNVRVGTPQPQVHVQTPVVVEKERVVVVEKDKKDNGKHLGHKKGKKHKGKKD